MMISSRIGNKVFDSGFVQRREWMLYKIRQDQYPFNIPVYLGIGAFDPLLFQRIINIAVERHEILRTTLKVMNGNLKQVIHSPDSFPVGFSYFEIQNVPEADRRYFHRDKLAMEMGRPFDFESGPLFRILVFEITPSHFAIHFVFHHMISDEHSTVLFINELGEIYKMLSRDEAPSLTFFENIVQYRNYSDFENELLDTSKGDKYRKYWKETMANGIPDLDLIAKDRLNEYYSIYQQKVNEVKERVDRLPYFDERFMATTIRRYQVEDAGEVKYIYARDLFDRIKIYEGAGKNGLLSLFIGGLLLAFHKLSGQTRFAFEIPASRRAAQGFMQTMGWLTSQGPCCFDISGNKASPLLLDYIDKQLYLLSKYCVYPCEAVTYDSMRLLGSHMPVFLSLTYSDQDAESKESGIIFKRSQGSGTYQDIAFFFMFFNNGAALNVTYNNLLFTPDQVELLINEHLISLDSILSSF